MNLKLSAIQSAKDVLLPDRDEILEMTDYDRHRWTAAFDWFNTHMDYKADMNKGHDYSKVYLALRTAKQFTQ